MAEDAKVDRRGVLGGVLGGVIAGGGAGFLAGRGSAETSPVVVGGGAVVDDAGGDPFKIPHAHVTFAQQGEDRVMQAMVRDVANIAAPTYIDIGAYDPIQSNNTYLFTLVGGHGVLVEPNPALTERLRAARPRDVVLDVGVGVTDQAEADYYVFSRGDGQLNTFSKDQVDALGAQGIKVDSVIKRRLVKIDDILAKHFPTAAPDVFSIDIEGMDLAVLKTMSFERWRPLVFCVETSDVRTGDVERDILEYLAAKGYEVRGGSFVNTVFLDTKRRKG